MQELHANIYYSANYTAPVTTWQTQNVYQYEPFPWLWAPYSIAIGVSFFAVATGLLSLWKNRRAYDNGFEDVVMATRGLDSGTTGVGDSVFWYDTLDAPSHFRLGTCAAGSEFRGSRT